MSSANAADPGGMAASSLTPRAQPAGAVAATSALAGQPTTSTLGGSAREFSARQRERAGGPPRAVPGGSHLLAALAAVLLLLAGLIGWIFDAVRLEDDFVHALAPRLLRQKTQGGALQAATFRQPDLLSVYGSSELAVGEGARQGTQMFGNFPTGFAVSWVAWGGMTDLLHLQQLASVGADLRGKKVAISLTTGTLIGGLEGVYVEYYHGNFSPLHAGELAFSTELGFAVKQSAARRMLEYPKTLEGDPFLKFALERLAEDSPASRALYYAMLPLGKLRNLLLRLQDHWDVTSFIRGQPSLAPTVQRRPSAPDWTALALKAEQEYKQKADNNPFGFENQVWTENGNRFARNKNVTNDQAFVRGLESSKAWLELELLLQGLQDLGAESLLLSQPIHGAFYDYMGISASARRVFYDKLREVAQRYAVSLVDFADHDSDPYFLIDPWGHLSPKGWIYYNQALDGFYHGHLR